MAPNPNVKNTIPFIRPHIPDSFTSGSLQSEDSPTPAPKRKKTAVSSSLSRVAENPSSLSALASTIQTLSRSVEELLRSDQSPKVVKPELKEEEKHEEDEEESDTGDESSSEQEGIEFEEFDTAGMTEEELKAWSSSAPMDQKLVMGTEEPQVHPSRRVHFSEDQSSDKGKVETDTGKVGGEIKRQWIENFIRNHTFFKSRQTSSRSNPSPAQEKAFEKEVYDHAKRKLGFSMRNAKKQIIKARQMCGYDDGDVKIKDGTSLLPSDATIDNIKSNTSDRDSTTSANSKDEAIRATKETVDPTTKLDPNAQLVPEVIKKVESNQKLSSKKRKRDQPKSEDLEPDEAVDNSKSMKKHKKRKSKQAKPHSTDPMVQSKPLEHKSDGINGDPFQLPEVPEYVSRYLDVQAEKKKRRKSQDHGSGDVSSKTGEVSVHPVSKSLPSKSDATQPEKASPEIAKANAENLMKVASADLETTEADDTFTKEDGAERKARKKERRRKERMAKKLSANDEDAKPSAASASLDDTAKTQLESSPEVQSRTSKTLKGDKKERRQKGLIAAEPRRENLGLSGEESRKKPKRKAKHSHISSPQSSNSKKQPLEDLVDEAVCQSKKQKKKHKPKGTPSSQNPGFQSPMIHDAETANEGSYESVLWETTTTESTTTLAALTTASTKLSNADIDILFPFSDSPLSTPPSSPILPPSPLQLHIPLPPPLITSPPATPTKSPSPTKRKPLLPKISPYFPTPPRTPRPKVKRPAVSCIPFPPLSAPRFGLVQESLARSPFALLIAVIFLNKTRGKVALPLFYQLMKKWPTPEKLAGAEMEEVVQVFSTLGLQNQRAKKVVELAKAWVDDVPRRGRRWRRLHYPTKGDGSDVGREEFVGDENDESDGEHEEKREEGETNRDKGNKRVAWEVGRLPGVGSYAIDSWRIFCRDELRGLPHGLPSLDELTDASQPEAREEGHADKSQLSDNHQPEEHEVTDSPKPEKVNQKLREELSKEWTRVLPLDKELRAYLRWRWLRLGYIWDPVTGSRERASAEMIMEAEKGGVIVEEEGRVMVEGMIPKAHQE